MDAARYFEMMHRAMSARKRDTTLLLRVKVQDLGGADAYLELRQEPGSARVRVFYSTMPLMQAGPSASCTSCAAAPATTPPPCPATRGRGRSSRWTAL